jgi:Tol biopolymer transport system component
MPNITRRTFIKVSSVATADAMLGRTKAATDIVHAEAEDPPFAQDVSSLFRIPALRWSDACLAWSPQGDRLALAAVEPGSPLSSDMAIWSVGLDGSRPHKHSDGSCSDAMPAWSPDGTRLAFISDRGGGCDIYTMAADGSEVVRLTEGVGQNAYPAWSPDGSSLAFSSDRSGHWQIWVMASDGREQRRLTTSMTLDSEPAWSPDGEGIAFSSRPLCMGYSSQFRSILWVRHDGTDRGALISEMADSHAPAWSPDGLSLAFISFGPHGRQVRVVACGVRLPVYQPRVVS